jgi:hypothetical protein
MKFIRVVVFSMLVLPRLVEAAVTRVATFENFSEGDSFKPSFTDPLSGITFRDSSHPGGGFVIDYSATLFGDGNYLTAGVYVPGPGSGFGAFFGFTGDLPQQANEVGVDVRYGADRSEVSLQGFDALGNLLAQQGGPPGQNLLPFSLEIHSSAFEIRSFRVSVGGGAAGYDNISYTIVPEPAFAWGVLGIGALSMQRRR